MAGATAVGIGTAWFVNVNVFKDIKDGLEGYCAREKTTISEKTGCLHGH